MQEHILILDEAQSATQQQRHVVLPPPSVEPMHDVFAEAMLEESSTRQRRSPLDWVVSLAVHVAVLATLLILPLFFTNNLNMQRLNLTFLAPPMTPAAPPPPLIRSSEVAKVRNVPVHTFVPGKLTAPSVIPKVIASVPSDMAAPDVMGGVPGGVPGGQVGGVVGGVLGGVLSSVPAPVPVQPAAVAEGPRKPVRVGGNVKPPKLIFGPEPEYPGLARQSHISGVVVIEAIIDEHGNVTGMRAISGHPLLIQAALSAVSKRKYEPTILDGEPTPIDLRVEVSFSVG